MTLPKFNTDTCGFLVYNNNHLAFLEEGFHE
jgi:hypothetical protein